MARSVFSAPRENLMPREKKPRILVSDGAPPPLPESQSDATIEPAGSDPPPPRYVELIDVDPDMRSTIHDNSKEAAKRSRKLQPDDREIEVRRGRAMAEADRISGAGEDLTKSPAEKLKADRYKDALAELKQEEDARRYVADHLNSCRREQAGKQYNGAEPKLRPGVEHVLAMTVGGVAALTVHDLMIASMRSNVAWVVGAVFGVILGYGIAWTMLGTITHPEGQKLRVGGLALSILIGIALAIVRVHQAEEAGEYLLGVGLALFEIAVVAFIDLYAASVRKAHSIWREKIEAYETAIAQTRAAEQELSEKDEAIATLTKEVKSYRDHVAALEALRRSAPARREAYARASDEGYLAGIAENVAKLVDPHGMEGR